VCCSDGARYTASVGPLHYIVVHASNFTLVLHFLVLSFQNLLIVNYGATLITKTKSKSAWTTANYLNSNDESSDSAKCTTHASSLLYSARNKYLHSSVIKQDTQYRHLASGERSPQNYLFNSLFHNYNISVYIKAGMSTLVLVLTFVWKWLVIIMGNHFNKKIAKELVLVP